MEHIIDANSVAYDLHVTYNSGLLAMRENNIEQAIFYFKKVWQVDADYLNTAEHLANMYLLNKDPESAKLLYENIVEKHPNNIDVLNNLAAALLQQKKYVEALAQYANIFLLDPEHLIARHNMASVFLELGRFDEAIYHYQLLLEKTPTDLEVLYHLGFAQMSNGLLEAAYQTYEKLLALSPEHIAALQNSAACLLKLNQKDAALIRYQKILLLKPHDDVALYMQSVLTGSNCPTQAPDLYVQQLFDNYASFFEKHATSALQYEAYQHVYEQAQAHLENKTITSLLDLGCGTGLSGVLWKNQVQRLVGIDISEKMLTQARAKNIYDDLQKAFLSNDLMKITETFSLITAADVLVYLGELNTLFEQVNRLLVPAGLWIFTTEISHNAGDYELQLTGRYAHSPDYIEMCLAQHHFTLLEKIEITLRQQDGAPLCGFLWVAKK